MNTEQYLKRKANLFQSDMWGKAQHPLLIKELLSATGMQRNYTPVELCIEITGKLSEYANLVEAKIAVLFNLEFVDTLIRVYRVEPANITFFADSKIEADAARKWYKVECPNELIAWDADKKRIIMPNIKKKFDVVVMNPPYQGQSKGGGEGRNNLLWMDFVKKAFDLAAENGFVANIHPSLWRKPNHEMYNFLAQKDIRELHITDNNCVFEEADTRADWYVAQNCQSKKNTKIIDQQGIINMIDMSDKPFIPNYNIEFVFSLLANSNQKPLNIFYKTFYHNDAGKKKGLISVSKTDVFKYPVVHSIIKGNQPVIVYTSDNTKQPFGIKHKVIVNTGRHAYCVFDEHGEYGTTEGCFAIVCDTKDEMKKISTALCSKKFAEEIVKATKWSNFRMDYKFFRLLRKDFWKEFI